MNILFLYGTISITVTNEKDVIIDVRGGGRAEGRGWGAADPLPNRQKYSIIWAKLVDSSGTIDTEKLLNYFVIQYLDLFGLFVVFFFS